MTFLNQILMINRNLLDMQSEKSKSMHLGEAFYALPKNTNIELLSLAYIKLCKALKLNLTSNP